MMAVSQSAQAIHSLVKNGEMGSELAHEIIPDMQRALTHFVVPLQNVAVSPVTDSS